jgi:hypothetical protein
MTLTSSLAKSAAKARDLFAASTTFQGETGGTAAAAATRVYFGSAPGGAQRPFVVVNPTAMSRAFAGGAQYFHRPEGSIPVVGERNVPSQQLGNDSEANQEAEEFWGKVLDEMSALPDSSNATSEWSETHLAALSASVDELLLNDKTYAPSLGRFSVARMTLTWGDG